MAAFSNQQQFQPFLPEQLLLPSTPSNTLNATTTVLNSLFGPSDQVLIHENNSIIPKVINCPDQGSTEGNNGIGVENETPFARKQSTTESSSDAEQVCQKLNPMNRKRKRVNWSSLTSAESKVAREGRSRNQKKCNEEENKRMKKAKTKDDKKGNQEQPKDYIHVRARRGQATDSHSLAERVRREKISERMKILQQLVPGCDKVTGKALMLDEIINYVQSLQNQVEFLSMKLASLSPVFYDFGVDLDAFMIRQEGLAGLAPSDMPRVQQMCPTQSASALTTASPSPLPFPLSLLDNPSSLLLPQPNHPLLIPPQDNVNVVRDVEGQRQKYANPTGFTNNLCSFH